MEEIDDPRRRRAINLKLAKADSDREIDHLIGVLRGLGVDTEVAAAALSLVFTLGWRDALLGQQHT